MVVRTIRPDTVFIPYHWPGRKSANLLTHRTLDPRSKIPEFKVRRAGFGRRTPAGWSPTEAERAGRALTCTDSILHRSLALHRLPELRQCVRGVWNAPRSFDDSCGLHRPGIHNRDDADGLHALRRSDVRQSCPADAIKKGEDGVVRSALKPRCIACSNCVLACPFGVPKVHIEMELMMKCDMCYDRTSVGKRPMCATVCPSQALLYTTREEAARLRRDKPVNRFLFRKPGSQDQGFYFLPQGRRSLEVDVLMTDVEAEDE